MRKIIFVILVSFVGIPFGAFAQEKIISFDANIFINKDATVDIEENIVYDFGSAQKHGLFRIIPIKYSTDVGLRTIKITDVDVFVDDDKETYKIDKRSKNLEIRIGDTDKTITGKHTYKIKYNVKGALNYFEDYDEFYWNVTGNEWPVDMTSVTARVDAPSITKLKCFQGSYGSMRECLIDSKGDRSA